jgi:hypothetical protein
MERCGDYFAWSGFLVDQPFQERLADGMIRAYLVHDKVVGYQHQWPTGLLEGSAAADREPKPRGMEPPDAPAYRLLRDCLESEWIPQLKSLLGLDATALPVIWDADFLYGPKTGTGVDSYVLCEINVSCVWPFPPHAATTIAQAALDRTRQTMSGRETSEDRSANSGVSR